MSYLHESTPIYREHEASALAVDRPLLFNGREWLQALREQNGENLQGLSLSELAHLPDIEWPSAEPTLSVSQRLGRSAVLHPSQPGFSFEDCPDFFDGEAYLAILAETYGENLEALSGDAIRSLPKVRVSAAYQNDALRRPVEIIDLKRREYLFLGVATERHFS